MAWWTRKRIARELGVSAQRVHQLQVNGKLAPAVEDDDSGIEGWPESYATSFVARRQGRRVSQSVFGLSPAPASAELVDDTTIQIWSDDRPRIHAMRFAHPEADVILLQPLALPAIPVFATTPGAGAVVTTFSAEDPGARLAALRAAELWLDGDITRAAFVVMESGSIARFSELVLIQDPSQQSSRALPHLAASRQEILPQGRGDRVSPRMLAEKLGRQVPVFAPEYFTTDTLEKWQAEGREPVTITADCERYEERIVAASIVTALSTVAKRDRESLVSGLLEEIKWDASGNPPEQVPFFDAGIGESWQEQAEQVAPQLLLKHPDFAGRLPGSKRELPTVEPLRADAFEQLANRIQDTIYNTYGEHGDTPSPRIEHALRLGLSTTYGRAQSASHKEERYGEFWTIAPMGTRPYALRVWKGENWATRLVRDYEAAFKPRPHPDGAAARAAEAKLRKLASYDPEQPTGHVVEHTGDLTGIRVARIHRTLADGERQTWYCAAIPVARTDDEINDLVRGFTSIIAEPDTQDGPVFLDTPAGPALMPFGRPPQGGFTHGYGGAGPSNLTQAIEGFLERLNGDSLPETVKRLVSAAVQTTEQYSPLTIPRSMLGPLGGPRHGR